MAGSIPLSMTQQMDQYGDPLSGGQLQFYVAGTVSTPQNAFQDLALTLPWPNPITLDAAGRVPQLFLADGYIKIRLTDRTGVVQLVADNVQVIGASSGGSGGASIDATTVLQTGDLKSRYGVGIHTGWVRCNGLTIGSALAIPSATERGNDDCKPLFQYLYGADPNLVVTGGRTGNSLNDWNSGKTIALPDGRGVTFAGLDDMGSTAAGRLTAAYLGTAATVLGARGGAQSHTLTIAQLAAHMHLAALTDPGHGHNFIDNGVATATINYTDAIGVGLNASGGSTPPPPAHRSLSIQGNSTGIRIWDGTTLDRTYVSGESLPHANVQPTMVVTVYIKL